MTDEFTAYPLRLSYGVRRYAFGDRAIPELLGKADVPEGVVAETWEVSDHDDEPATVLNGTYRGTALRELVTDYPDALVRPGWRGSRLPLLVKFLDAKHMLPVHVHPDDERAMALYGEPNGKDEAWHVLWAEPGASVLVGLRPGLSRASVRAALLGRAYDEIMVRHPVRVGDTVDVPGGVLHSFGPDLLILEVQQTSDLAESAMPDDLYGGELPRARWEANVDATLELLTSDVRPRPSALQVLHEDDAHRRSLGCRNERFVLERWTLRGSLPARPGEGGFVTLTNLGDALTIEYAGGREGVERASSRLLPASLGEVILHPQGNGEVVLCFEPGPDGDVPSGDLESGNEM